MKLEGGELLVLKTLLALQGEAVEYVEDSRLASAARMFVQDVRDWLETLEGKGFVERVRGTVGFSAYVTAKGKQALRLTEPMKGDSSTGPGVKPGDHRAGPAVAPSQLSPMHQTTAASVAITSVQIPDSTASDAIQSPGHAARPQSPPSGSPITGNPEVVPVTSGVSSQGDYQIVLLIHGIKTQAEWQSMVREKIAIPGKIEVIPIGYGYFDVFRFWFPFWTRNGPIERVHDEIRVALQKYRKTHPEARLSIIAHSFGTYIVGKILQRHFDLQVHRLILCGSVLPQEFSWNQLQGRFDDDKVVNECGKADIWPVLAQSLSWGYGASGTHGFKKVLVKDRFHAGGHGQYFEPDFVEKYWVPFIQRGKYKGTEFEKKMPPTPSWISMLGYLPLKWPILVLIIILASAFPMSCSPTLRSLLIADPVSKVVSKEIVMKEAKKARRRFSLLNSMAEQVHKREMQARDKSNGLITIQRMRLCMENFNELSQYPSWIPPKYKTIFDTSNKRLSTAPHK